MNQLKNSSDGGQKEGLFSGFLNGIKRFFSAIGSFFIKLFSSNVPSKTEIEKEKEKERQSKINKILKKEDPLIKENPTKNLEKDSMFDKPSSKQNLKKEDMDAKKENGFFDSLTKDESKEEEKSSRGVSGTTQESSPLLENKKSNPFDMASLMGQKQKSNDMDKKKETDEISPLFGQDKEDDSNKMLEDMMKGLGGGMGL